jgi:predicted nucleic acid-binding Zn ribbon protein
MTKKMADVISELLNRRGYARVRADAAYADAWSEAAGEQMARYTRPGNLRRGVLEVLVANSTLMQELTFQKQAILNRLARRTERASTAATSPNKTLSKNDVR